MVVLAIIVLAGGIGLYLGVYQSLAAARPVPSGCVDIPPVPDYLATGSTHDAIAALNHAHALVGLAPLKLPQADARPALFLAHQPHRGNVSAASRR